MGTGSKVRALRVARKWTLEQLAEKSEVAVGTIHAIEARDSSRSIYFPQLAKAFGLSVEAMAAYDEKVPAPPEASTPAPGLDLTGEQLELLAEWKDIPPWKRGPILERIREAAAQSRDEKAYYLADGDGKKNDVTAELRKQPKARRTAATVNHGDGNPKQTALTLTAANPFDPNSAPANEKAWYRQLALKPKASEA